MTTPTKQCPPLCPTHTCNHVPPPLTHTNTHTRLHTHTHTATHTYTHTHVTPLPPTPTGHVQDPDNTGAGKRVKLRLWPWKGRGVVVAEGGGIGGSCRRKKAPLLKYCSSRDMDGCTTSPTLASKGGAEGQQDEAGGGGGGAKVGIGRGEGGEHDQVQRQPLSLLQKLTSVGTAGR